MGFTIFFTVLQIAYAKGGEKNRLINQKNYQKLMRSDNQEMLSYIRRYLVKIRPHIQNKLVQPINLHPETKAKTNEISENNFSRTQDNIKTKSTSIHDHNLDFSPKVESQALVAAKFQSLAQPKDELQDPDQSKMQTIS